MRKMLLCFAMVAIGLVLPKIAVAEEPEKAWPPAPEMLFNHLDTNHDGVISEDEIPAAVPEPLKALLKAADKNGDKKVSLEEFRAAVKEHPLPRPPFGMPGAPGNQPGNMPPPPFGMPMPGMHGMHGGRMPPFGLGSSDAGMGPQGPPGLPHGGPLGNAPDLKELFEKLDKDKDGKLTLDEFTEGMKQLHKTMMEHAGPGGSMPGGPIPPQFPMPNASMPHPFLMPGMMSPPPFPMPGMMPHWGPGPWMMKGPMPGWHGNAPCSSEGECPLMKATVGDPSPTIKKDGMTLDIRVKDLEAKVKALEAELKAK